VKIARTLVLQMLCVIAAGAAASPGRLDIFGCHVPLGTGIKHCHTPQDPQVGSASRFPGPWSQYAIERTSDGFVVTPAVGLPQTVASPRLQFADHFVALDAEGVPGQIYRLYRAALQRSPDESGVGFHMASMEEFGLSLVQIAEQFMASPEFTTRFGNQPTAEFVTQLYRNILGREPDPGGHAFHAGNLDASRLSRAQVLLQFSESAEYQANTAAEIANGIAYVPYQRPATAPVSPFGR
jgi:serralysin